MKVKTAIIIASQLAFKGTPPAGDGLLRSTIDQISRAFVAAAKTQDLMNKTTAFAVAFAAALYPVAAPAMSLSTAALAAIEAVAHTARSVSALSAASIDAQSRLGFPATVEEGLEQRPLFHAIIARYSAAYGVPLDLAHAVVQVESNYRPDARGGAGEVGLMQIKPATARGMGFRGPVTALYDPETNIRYGMMYLGKARELGGRTVCGTILRYNAGHAAKRMNRVSRAYCNKVQRLLAD